MKLRRKITLGVTTLFIAAATGHMFQGNDAPRATQAGQAPDRRSSPVVPAPPVAKVVLVPNLPAPALAVPEARAFAETAQADSAVFPDNAETSAPPTSACILRIDMAAQPMALVGAALFAPCHPNERVVILHEGLAITALTSDSGSLFFSLPALAQDAHVTVLFAGGDRAEAALKVPEAAEYQRFVVQWQGDDAFQLHALENGADLGTPGDISALNAQLPVPDAAPGLGFLLVLGDPTVDFPLLAEVYTFPIRPTDVRLVVEAAVTRQTCGREILGETLAFNGTGVVATDLTMAMPDCTGIGDRLVMQGFDPLFTLAAN